MTADTISLSPSVPVNGKPKAIPSSKLGTNPTSGVPASDGQNGQNGQDVDAQNVHTTNDSEKSTQTTTSGLVTDSSVLHRNLKVTLPIITHAKGSYLYTSTGRILDGSGGAAVVSVGHCVPEIVEAVSRQLSTVPYVSSALFAIAPAEELAARMCKDSGMERAIFLSGGSEAVESAIKLARQYHCERGEGGRTEFIAREGSYHGNTLGALALGRHLPRREFNEPLLSPHFHSVSPCNAYRFQHPGESSSEYVARLASELDAKINELGADRVAAFFAEPVVGAATGCVPFVPGYLRAMKRVCERYGVLFVLDEIMCGAGRTGKLHAWMNDVDRRETETGESDRREAGAEGRSDQREDGTAGSGAAGEGQGEGGDKVDAYEEVRPHIQTLGKGLCGGYAPLSAVLVSRKVVEGLQQGSGAFRNGYTFQSSGTGVAAGLAVYDYIERHGLVEQCAARGRYLRHLLETRVSPLPHVGNVRGLGLFQGIEFVANKETKTPFPASDHVADHIAAAILHHGAAVYHGAATATTGDHVMLCPPYTVSEGEIEELVEAVVKGIKDVFPQ